MIWCPYLGTEIDRSAATPEHIIPLSLGGSNGFTVLVDRSVNSKIGSEIDAALASKDALIVSRRAKFGVRGHSNKTPLPSFRKAKYGKERKPAIMQARGTSSVVLFDARDKTEVPEEVLRREGLRFEMQLQPYARIRFVAKVALSAGFEIYGNLFRKYAEHSAVRNLMNSSSSEEAELVTEGSNLRGFFEFYSTEENSGMDVAREKALCASVDGSVVIAIPTEGSLIFTVGLLGQWIGTLNIPTVTAEYPKDGLHDLGHVVTLVDKKTERISVRTFLNRFLKNSGERPDAGVSA